MSLEYEKKKYKVIKEMVKEDEDVEILMTMPGIGFVGATTIASYTKNIERFGGDFKRFSSYLGTGSRPNSEVISLSSLAAALISAPIMSVRSSINSATSSLDLYRPATDVREAILLQTSVKRSEVNAIPGFPEASFWT